MSTRQGGLAASSAQKRATYLPVVLQDNRPSETMGPRHSLPTTSQTKVSKPALSAAGRLKRSFDFWKNTLKANKLILSVISHGYRIPFVELPTACTYRNNVSSLNNVEFVRSEILDLKSKGYIQELSHRPFCCNPLTVAEGKKKKRLCLDLSRHVNKFVTYEQTQLENWSSLEQILEPNNFAVTFDFTASYHHIPISEDHYKYLGFAFDIETNMKTETHFYNFTYLPFGLCSSNYIMSKLTRPLLKLWRSMGINSFIFIDDGIAIFRTLEEANKLAPKIKADLIDAGFLINEQKSNWEPSQVFSWLGFNFDSTSMRISVDEEKIINVVKNIKSVLHRRMVSPRQVAQIVGQLIAMGRAIGNQARVMTRDLTSWMDSTLQKQVRPESDNSQYKINHETSHVTTHGSKHFYETGRCREFSIAAQGQHVNDLLYKIDTGLEFNGSDKYIFSEKT